MGLRQKLQQEILPTTLLAFDLHDAGHDDDDDDDYDNDDDDDDDYKIYDDDVDDKNDDNGCDNCYDAPPFVQMMIQTMRLMRVMMIGLREAII